MMGVYTSDKVDVVLHPALFSQNDTIKAAILEEASSQLSRKITWDDVESYEVTLEVELSLFATEH